MTHRLPLLLIPALLAACAAPEDELVSALPDRDTVTVSLPEDVAQAGRGLSRRALVGEPADLYASTYYASRDINRFGAMVVDLVEAITAYPPTEAAEDRAVWGPFSEPREPNEHRLIVERRDATRAHFVWGLQGRPRAGGAYTDLAAGAFEPATTADHGRGWFFVDFDAIRTLDPTENGRGRAAYAFGRDAGGVRVEALFDRPEGRAAYRFGEAATGEGFVAFAAPADIDDGDPARALSEDLLIRTRWTTSGTGRADVVATAGDLGARVAYGTQCWDERFVSTFEAFVLDGQFLVAAGEPASCRLGEARPDPLPTAEALRSPYPTRID